MFSVPLAAVGYSVQIRLVRLHIGINVFSKLESIDE
jgi:hypothetical protein